MKFEEKIKRLEVIVAQMESDELPLSEGVELYKEAAKIVMDCRDEMDKAENTVMLLRKKLSGEIILEEFSGDDDD